MHDNLCIYVRQIEHSVADFGRKINRQKEKNAMQIRQSIMFSTTINRQEGDIVTNISKSFLYMPNLYMSKVRKDRKMEIKWHEDKRKDL